eukprot:3884846-Rhodomonas_salina.1
MELWGCYAVAGTEPVYGAGKQGARRSTVLAHVECKLPYRPTRVLRSVQYCDTSRPTRRMVLCPCYAVSGTDVACGATRRWSSRGLVQKESSSA